MIESMCMSSIPVSSPLGKLWSKSVATRVQCPRLPWQVRKKNLSFEKIHSSQCCYWLNRHSWQNHRHSKVRPSVYHVFCCERFTTLFPWLRWTESKRVQTTNWAENAEVDADDVCCLALAATKADHGVMLLLYVPWKYSHILYLRQTLYSWKCSKVGVHG